MTRCFVIGPIGDRLAPLGSPQRDTYENALQVYEHVISAACGQVGLTPLRADHIAAAGEITEQVFRHLYEDEIVIADVTDGNPNVMYELGLRHTRNLLTVQIGEYGSLPFDVAAVRTIMFSRSERGLIEARNALVSALQFGMAEGSDPVTATRVWNAAEDRAGKPVALDEELTGLDLDVDDVEPEGLFDAMETVETSFVTLTAEIEAVGEALYEMAAVTEEAGRDITAANDTGGLTASERLGLIKTFADRLAEVGQNLESHVVEYADEMDKIDGSVNGILNFIAENLDSDPEDYESFMTSLEELASSAREAMENFGDMQAGLRDMGKLSRLLRTPAKRIDNAVSQLIAKSRLIDEWEASVIRIRNRRAGGGTGEGGAAGA